MKVHDLALRADYEIASKEHEYFFELDVSFSLAGVHERHVRPLRGAELPGVGWAGPGGQT